MKNVTNIFIISLLFALSTGLSFAADIKIGVVNSARIMAKAPQAGKATAALEKEFAPRQKRLIASQQAIKKLDEKLARDAKLMSAAESRKLQTSIREKTRDLKRDQEEFREDFNLRRNEELGKIQRIIGEAIKALAESEKYDLVLADGVIFASKTVDITGKVLQRLSK